MSDVALINLQIGKVILSDRYFSCYDSDGKRLGAPLTQAFATLKIFDNLIAEKSPEI